MAVEEATSAAGSERVRLSEPVKGWASKKCLQSVASNAWAAAVAATGMARWAVDSSAWSPAKQDKSAEFQFLLSLIGEAEERKGVTQYLRWEDRVRALMSRLLSRRCSALALGLKQGDVTVERTKGRKPFLSMRSRSLSDLSVAAAKPNFNFNVSHEGQYVVLASEPFCVCGVDVAAPDQFRRSGGAPEQDLEKFFSTMKDILTKREWAYVRDAQTPDAQALRFRYFWSCKEAFTKARGDGLAFGLGKAEFDLTLRPGPKLAFDATVAVDGKRLPDWRFAGEELGNGHIVTVARGPPADIIDAKGEFKATIGVQRVGADHLDAPKPDFALLTARDLVPSDRIGDYLTALKKDAKA